MNASRTLQDSNQYGSTLLHIVLTAFNLASCYGNNALTIWESYQNPETIKDVLFSILSSLYIQAAPQKRISELFASYEYTQLTKLVKNAVGCTPEIT